VANTPIPSGYYYPNRFALILLKALEEIMGRNGLNAVLNMGGLSHWITNPPPDNMEKSEFDFAYMAALNEALEEMYGRRGGRGLQLRLGRVLFVEGLANFGALVGASDLAFKIMPLSTKLKAGLPAVAKVFDSLSDQTSYVVDPGEDHYLYHIARCSMCWDRKVDHPVCFIATGILEEALRWVSSGRTFRVDEITCIGMGDQTCSYAIYKEPIG